MKTTNHKVFELAPPGTETPLFRDDFDETDLARMKGMDVRKLVQAALTGLGDDVLEIRPGLSNILKLLSRIALTFALDLMAKSNADSLGKMRTKQGRIIQTKGAHYDQRQSNHL